MSALYDSIPILAETLKAPSAVTKHRFVKINGAMAGAGEAVFGVAQYDAATGDHYAATVAGRIAVEAGAAITLGQRVKSDAQGRAIPAATEDAAAGMAVSAAAGAGYPVRILRFPAA